MLEWKDGTPLYSNLIIMELYENDTLVASVKESDKLKNVFNSYYSWKGDTLFLSGAFGLPAGPGFRMRIVKDKAKLCYTLSPRDIYPAYAYTENGPADDWLEVACKDVKIILSEMPDQKKKKIIYGYVEFKTTDYYICNLGNKGKENLPRTRQRKEMKIYFISGHYEYHY